MTIGFFSRNESKLLVLYSFSVCIRRLLSLEGSLYLFSPNYSYEEALIGLLASRVQQLCWIVGWVPNCGQCCIWQGDLIVCFGGWCINRIFELLLVETRPEIWLICTSLLNRLKGIIEPAFLVEQPPLLPCFCFDLLDSVAMGLELASSYETSRARFKRKYAARNMAREAYYSISCRSHAYFESGDMVVIKRAMDLMSVLQHYSNELLLDL
ncbi:hypothetical protein LUZ63_001796 [Rhynchospora breviuscula]|uniref:Uncharacterized protein n=1 Tax=Rhynchospora breviuscula TaxID=2022672 RepID=A0A9Q0CXK3_9POAL|nr:hypothetical protein LUZ63_001796 [Rhynchospora breviuscula]